MFCGGNSLSARELGWGRNGDFHTSANDSPRLTAQNAGEMDQHFMVCDPGIRPIRHCHTRYLTCGCRVAVKWLQGFTFVRFSGAIRLRICGHRRKDRRNSWPVLAHLICSCETQKTDSKHVVICHILTATYMCSNNV